VSSSLSSLPSQRRCDRDRAVEDEYEDEEAEFERLLRKSSVRDMQEETKGFAEEAKVWDADDSENRWQLHKHDRLPSPGSIAQGDVYELADVGRVALEHDRLLRRCFDKLAKHCFERLRLRQAWTDIEAQRRRRLFKSWQHAFFATRMHRIRTLFQFFETWRDVAKENRKFEQLCMIGDTFFELRGKRLVLQRLSDFVSAQKRSFASNRLAKTSQRHRVLSRTFSLWAEARELGEVERSRKETADLFLRAVRLHRGFSTLGRHKRLQIAAQEVRRRARVGLARQTLEIWRARTSEEQQMRLKLLGACVVYDISLCQGAVRQWRRFTLQQRRLHWAARFHDRQLKRKALRGLRLHVVERRRGQDVALKADLFRSERLSLRGLRRLCELVVAQRDERRAVALCEVHLLRKTFGHWYEIASIEGLERKAFHNWVIRSKQVTLRRLELRALESRQRRLHNNLAAMHARESCLRGAFVLWARTAVQIVHERRGLRAAAAMNTLLVMRANFTHWADLVFAKQRLADVYNHVLTMKTVGLCVTAWREHSARWIWMRNEVKLGQLDRTFQAWYELTVDAKYSRHSVQMAAMFRRQRLLETTFFAWQDHLVAVRSERMVLVMAAQHAERRLLCRVMLAWHIQSLRLEVVEPLDERGHKQTARLRSQQTEEKPKCGVAVCEL
ncbi:Hypothetical protein SCF082_LOCUS50504, partial [Durusdinium trenchii]